ncbi:hypothetical protein [Streptomyces cellulosae]|uniref:Uncharacterized protein n=1 Tax=Streptomyces cellulosae TaxID=1968 RepID=A0ABW7XXZ5_STRCE|nr:hypothetical protein [Streptomyces cellulosae]
MYEYELQQLRSADLIRRADQERLARQAARGNRAARREAARRQAETASHTDGPHRHRFARTA